MDYGDKAKANFLSGLNCSQAVVLAFSDKLNVSEESLKRLTIGFGGGLARQRLTCGAVSGMAMVLGAIYPNMGKGEIYALIQKACEDFKKETGSIICAEMLDGITKDTSPKPEERTLEYYKKRPCAELCKLAGDIVGKYLEL